MRQTKTKAMRELSVNLPTPLFEALEFEVQEAGLRDPSVTLTSFVAEALEWHIDRRQRLRQITQRLDTGTRTGLEDSQAGRVMTTAALLDWLATYQVEKT